jgi:hypothetical protein
MAAKLFPCDGFQMTIWQPQDRFLEMFLKCQSSDHQVVSLNYFQNDGLATAKLFSHKGFELMI